MESVKKLLPFLLVAIVFAVGGYFIGAGSLQDQEAALYRAQMMSARTGTGTGTPGPTDPGCPDGTCGKPFLLNGDPVSPAGTITYILYSGANCEVHTVSGGEDTYEEGKTTRKPKGCATVSSIAPDPKPASTTVKPVPDETR